MQQGDIKTNFPATKGQCTIGYPVKIAVQWVKERNSEGLKNHANPTLYTKKNWK